MAQAPQVRPAEGDRAVQATVRLASGRPIVGLMAELGVQNVTLVCRAKDARDLEPGERVTLLLEGTPVGGVKEGPAHVESTRVGEIEARVTVRYLHKRDYDALIAAGAGRHFNRRGAFRVVPLEAEPVRVTVSDADGSFRHATTAADVSATGTAFLFGPAEAKDVDASESLQLSLALPGAARPAVLAARVCFRSESEGRVRFGVDFDRSASDDYDGQVERIVDYIMRRQRQMLREQKALPK